MKNWLLPSCLLLGLSACGGSDDSSSPDTGGGGSITPPPVAQAPEVELGESKTDWNDKLIAVAAKVTVHASGDASFQWSQTAGPAVSLVNATMDGVIVDASALELDSQVTLSLTVTDSSNQSSSDSVNLQLNDKISAAMASGDASLVTELTPQMVKRGLNHISQYRADGQELVKAI